MATTTSESEEERKTSKVRKKVRKEENKRCYMHLSSVNNEDVQHFTRTRWDTYRNYLKQWLCLQDQNKHLAEIYKHCSDVDFDAIPDVAGFHATCYRRFTDKSALFYAEKRTARAVGEPSAAAGQSAGTSETPRKKLRSRSGLPVASAGPVLPAICIICQKVEKYTRVGGKRQRDQLTQAETVSADLDRSRIHADEEAVTRISSTIDSMLNPFDLHQDGIVCLSSGTVASEGVKKDLLAAPERGEEAVKVFIDQRLLTKSVDIFAPIKAQKLKTFSDQAKTKTKSAAAKDVILRADKKLFSRLLIIGQSRKVDLRQILSYSLGTVSYPLASTDGSLAKTDKSALMNILENKDKDCLVQQVPSDGAILFDGMAVIQAMHSKPATFGELADNLPQYVVKIALQHKCTRIDFVIDQYPEISIKNLERSRRAEGGTQQVQIYGRDQKAPTQWKKFLSNGTNKAALAEFLFVAWRDADLTILGRDFSLYIAHGELCHCVTVKEGSQTVSAVHELTCDHEECDTRVFLHAQHAAQEHQTVVIKSPDTDVAVIAVSLQRALQCSLYFFTGVGNRTRIIDVAKVAAALGNSVCSALIGIHTFTGCDSTSAFHGKGKRKTFSLACQKDEYLTAFSNLGSSFNLDQSTFKTLSKYVCHLYGQASAKDVNDARYKAFCMASSALPELSIPPTSDALHQHCKRANYQAAVMRHSLTGMMCAPSPIGNGWYIEDGELTVRWMTRNPAPDSVLQVVHCGCKTSKCETERCSCMSAKMSCTDLCHCQNCGNVSKETEERGAWDDDTDESDIDE
ncbi:uncharacterized protein LOC133658193 [Entelurus aequoreus]|uniref:uncharacterized protein LOC133658193 n=1 Tax=Entelurus aequoreus TaxID=161455 RepID=UPI002B1E3B07|nr:uncharacterized protein LOC133658193 [Entelurus aequoreus]